MLNLATYYIRERVIYLVQISMSGVTHNEIPFDLWDKKLKTRIKLWDYLEKKMFSIILHILSLSIKCETK